MPLHPLWLCVTTMGSALERLRRAHDRRAASVCVFRRSVRYSFKIGVGFDSEPKTRSKLVFISDPPSQGQCRRFPDVRWIAQISCASERQRLHFREDTASLPSPNDGQLNVSNVAAIASKMSEMLYSLRRGFTHGGWTKLKLELCLRSFTDLLGKIVWDLITNWIYSFWLFIVESLKDAELWNSIVICSLYIHIYAVIRKSLSFSRIWKCKWPLSWSL